MSTETGYNSDQQPAVGIGGGGIVFLLKPYMSRLVLIIILLIMLALVNMALPFAVKLLIDDVFPNKSNESTGNWHLLWFILPALGLIYVVRNSLFYSSRMYSLRMSEDICFSLRKQLFERLQQMSLRFYKSHQPGKIGSRVMDDTFKIQSFIQEKLPTLLLSLLMCQILIVIIYVVNVRLAFATTIILPLHYMAYRRFRAPIRSSHKDAQEKLSTAYGNLVEKFLGMEVVKGFSAEERESDKFTQAIDDSRKSQIKSQRYHFTQKVVADLLVGLGTVCLFGFGAWEVKNSRMSPGVFFMYFGYVTMLYPAVLEVIGGFGHLSRATASIDRVFELLNEPGSEHKAISKSKEILHALEGKIEFCGVNFSYEPGQRVLRDLNFKIRAGEHVAITGPSGSGKSTLIGMLPRFLDSTSGEVKVDGRDVKDISINVLRGGFGTAFQEVFLFNTTLYENLRYARPSATPEEIVDACKLTGAHYFIKRLPKGYDTRLGDSGSELSRGEKQRITLARALIKDPQILILDEATASIDSQTARTVIQAIFERMQGRTVVMVTHEIELLDLTQRVLCISEGRLVFDGLPEDFGSINGYTDHASVVAKGYQSGDSDPATIDALPVVLKIRDDIESVRLEDVLRSGNTDNNEPENEAQSISTKSKPASTRHRGIFGIIIALFVMLFGCVSSTETTSSVLMENPRTSNGYMTVDTDNDGLTQLAAAVEKWDERYIENNAAAIAKETQQISLNQDNSMELDNSANAADMQLTTNNQEQELGKEQATQQQEAEASSEATIADIKTAAQDPPVAVQTYMDFARPEGNQPIVPVVDPAKFPNNAGKLVPLPKLSEAEIYEIIDSLKLKFETEQGYIRAGGAVLMQLPAVPDGVGGVIDLARKNTDDGSETILRLGYCAFKSQPPQLWTWGVIIAGETITVNPDIDQIPALLETTVAAINQMRQGLTINDLDKRQIQLSYVKATDSMTMLKALGITAYPDPNAMPATFTYEQLPVVIMVPAPQAETTNLIGGSIAGGAHGLSIGSTQATPMPVDVIGTPANELLVLYHPAHPEQFSQVKSLLDDWIDRPARQVFIEGMVLEISEDGLEDLGIQWQFQEGPIDWMLSSLNAGGPFDTLTFTATESRNLGRDWTVDIRALIREGKAEILSRPSVLTLNNRQAAIRVGEDIPIATSQEGMSINTNRVKFDFNYIPTGIMLNVKPRVTEDGSQITMLIDTIVSATVPGRDLEIRSPDGELLAFAPTVSTRRVQTHARVNNNTPFIIGGLVSKDRTVIRDKVPFLGDLPIIGLAFRGERTETSKREVIIVLTPYVLPTEQNIARSLPKDDELFDSFGNELFRDAYRIRTEDVFDLAFLLENRVLLIYRDLARTVIKNNISYASISPFDKFARSQIPGEQILVHRMIYEVVKRLELDKQVKPERMIYFVSRQESGGYSVNFLESTLRILGKGNDYTSFFKNNKGKALALTFNYDRNAIANDRLTTDPAPRIEMIDCADDKEWGRLLWELNQPKSDGTVQNTILIHSEDDLVRLSRAIMLKKIILLNGGQSEVSLNNFTVGKLLIMPEIKTGQAHVIDADVARYFFDTEHYYGATIRSIEDCLQEMDKTLRKPEIQPYLDGAEPPNWDAIADLEKSLKDGGEK